MGPGASAASTAEAGVAAGDAGALDSARLSVAGLALKGLGVAVGFGVGRRLVGDGFGAAALSDTGWIETYLPSQTIGFGS